MIIKCRTCGSEYEMPDIGVKPIMEDCPVCKKAKKAVDEVLKEIHGILPKSNGSETK